MRRGGRVIPGPGRGGFRGGRGGLIGGRGGLIRGRGGFGIPIVPNPDDGNAEDVADGVASLSTQPAEVQVSGEFEPDLDDVFLVKDLLKRAGELPDEIALMILDSAEYWACSATTVDYSNLQRGSLHIRGTTGENKFLVRSEPLGMTLWSSDNDEAWRSQARPQGIGEVLPREKLHQYVDKRIDSVLESPCRKIVFKIDSHDQGWGGNRGDEGTFKGSWTWFDAGIDRFASESESLKGKEASQGGGDVSTSALRPVWPTVREDDEGSTVYNHGLHADPEHKIQGNKTATRQTQHHVVEWNYLDDINPELSEADELEAMGRGRATGNGEFVRNLKLGDMVTIWGRARFGGWENDVKRVELKVYWKAV
ncbi:hypothetical protein E8E14_001822 [Neopestalotiopsis sp. 37M]|nr:hypothetical protein E8E14_001822 [Neopestalotiopsis sp. 37M]